MGLAIDIDSPFGPRVLPGAYVRITGISANFVTGQGQIRVEVYESLQARLDDFPPLPGLARNYNVPVTPFVEGEAGEDIRVALYDLVKSLPEWEGATDA